MNCQRQDELLAFANFVAGHEHVSLLRRRVLGHASALVQSIWRGTTPPRDQTDVLMLHATPFIGPGKLALSDMIRERHGLTVRQHFIGSWKDSLLNRIFSPPEYRVHPLHRLKAGIARYIVRKYQPKVIVVSSEDTLVPFLRHEAAQTGAKLVNIAHSLVFPTPLFAMCDYDYYFVYGRSSLEALVANPARYGDTRVVLAGSLELGRYQALPQALDTARQLTYFSTWLPKRYSRQYLDQFNEIVQFVQTHPNWKVVVRLHPLEDGVYWRAQAAKFGNIRLSGPDESIADSVRGSCITVCPAQSTTALDSACLGRLPIILDFVDSTEGCFGAYPELLRRADESLGDAVDRNLADLPGQLARMQTLKNNSLEVQGECQTLMSALIAELSQGRELGKAHFLAQPELPTWLGKGQPSAERPA